MLFQESSGTEDREQKIWCHHFLPPSPFLVTQSIAHTLAQNNRIKASQTREFNRIGVWEPPCDSTEVTAYSSCLEATNSLDFWASYRPCLVTLAPRSYSRSLRLGLIFFMALFTFKKCFYLCIYIFIICPTDLDIWIVHRHSFTAFKSKAWRHIMHP